MSHRRAGLGQDSAVLLPRQGKHQGGHNGHNQVEQSLREWIDRSANAVSPGTTVSPGTAALGIDPLSAWGRYSGER